MKQAFRPCEYKPNCWAVKERTTRRLVYFGSKRRVAKQCDRLNKVTSFHKHH